MSDLQAIEKSLKTITEEKKKIASSMESVDAFLLLVEINKNLQSLLNESKSKVDVLQTFSQIDFDIQSLANKTDQNLLKIEVVEKSLEARIKQIDMFQAKHQMLMTRVSDVLDELERVLKQF